nr:MAG TPA: hypothetical protein [Caudoviricetes sp.]
MSCLRHDPWNGECSLTNTLVFVTYIILLYNFRTYKI